MYFFRRATICPLGLRITAPYAAGPGLPRDPPSILARQAAGFASGAGSPNSPAPRWGGVSFAIKTFASGSRRRAWIWNCRGSRFGGVENAAAVFAGVNVVVLRLVN